jgi:hypothetical protein
MNSLPDLLVPRKTVKRKSKLITSELDNYQPLLACWLLDLTLSLGWYKKAKAASSGILEDSDFYAITGVKIEESIDFDGVDEKLFTLNNKPIK